MIASIPRDCKNFLRKVTVMQTTTRKTVLNVTFIALFAALCYILLAVLFIPFAGMYIHFGNLVVVLAALLIGGWQGGLAGSIGMGLFDCLNGYAVSSPKTFLLKFLIGLTAGVVYTFIQKRKKFPALPLVFAGLICAGVCGGLLVHTFEQNHAFTGKSAILFPIFAVIGILCLVFAGLKNRFPQKTAAAIIGATAGMLINLIGETAWLFVTRLLEGATVQAAAASAIIAQPSTLINAGIAVVGGVALFTALEKPVHNIIGE